MGRVPAQFCEYKFSATERCQHIPEYAVPVLDAVTVPDGTGGQLAQRGHMWCYEHATEMLALVKKGPLAERVEPSWVSAIQLATKQVGERAECLRLEEQARARDRELQDLMAKVGAEQAEAAQSTVHRHPYTHICTR